MVFGTRIFIHGIYFQLTLYPGHAPAPESDLAHLPNQDGGYRNIPIDNHITGLCRECRKNHGDPNQEITIPKWIRSEGQDAFG